jgi:hypothetical protein
MKGIASPRVADLDWPRGAFAKSQPRGFALIAPFYQTEVTGSPACSCDSVATTSKLH